jgi:hypothetical protein
MMSCKTNEISEYFTPSLLYCRSSPFLKDFSLSPTSPLLRSPPFSQISFSEPSHPPPLDGTPPNFGGSRTTRRREGAVTTYSFFFFFLSIFNFISDNRLTCGLADFFFLKWRACRLVFLNMRALTNGVIFRFA